jgi:hypothetical protein
MKGTRSMDIVKDKIDKANPLYAAHIADVLVDVGINRRLHMH